MQHSIDIHAKEGTGRDVRARFGAYRLSDELPSDDGASVYAAKSERDGGERVLRILRPELSRNSLVVRSFATAMRCTQLIQHQNLVPVLEFGCREGLLYAAEAGPPEPTLAELLARGRRLQRPVPAATAVAIALQLLAGLDALANAPLDDAPLGVRRKNPRGRPLRPDWNARTDLPSPHTELCPENVSVTRDGVVRIGKLGATRWAISADAVGMPLGVPGYSAPEVHEAPFGAGATADVFSVGVILAELLTNRQLFSRATTLGALIANHDADLRGLWDRAGAIAPELVAVLSGALVRKPEARYESAAAFAAALRDAWAEPIAEPEADVTRWVFDVGGLQKKSGQHVIGTRLELVARAEPSAPLLGLGVGADDGQLAVCAEAIATGQRFVESNLSARAKLSLRHMASSRIYRFGESVGALASWARPFSRERLLSMLFQLARSESTGLLLFRAGEVERRVYYESGLPRVFASTSPSSLFGSRLTRDGVLSVAEVDACVARAARSGIRLGEALVETGTLPASVVLNQLLRFQEASFLELGTWRDGVVAFVEQDCPEAKLPLSLRPHAAQIADLVRRHYNATELSRLVSDRPDRALRWAANAPFTPEELELTPTERVWLERATDGRSVRALLGAIDGPGGEQALTALAIGVSAGILEGSSPRAK